MFNPLSLSFSVFVFRLSVAVCVQCEVLPSGPVAADRGHHEVQKLVSSGPPAALKGCRGGGSWFLSWSLQVPAVPPAEAGHRFGPAALLLRHTRPAGLLHPAGGARGPRPRGASSGLHLRLPVRPEPDQGAGGEGGGAAQVPQVLNKSNAVKSCSITKVFTVILRGITLRDRKTGIVIQLNVMI